ncbi:MAG: hypothetical protein QFX32_01335 [Methanolinea sp.]|nr:hypothetical protein [Methanolinea sp.]
MPPRRSDEALSEVIGFILILALIAALASLYVTYVVPAQGRELEIKHMEKVYDQFLQYKATVDSLWLNDQRNVPVSSTFTLGTVTGLTQGGFVIPVFQPYPSSGTVVVNGRGEYITINAQILALGFPGNSLPNVNPLYQKPDHLYIQLKTTDRNQGGGIKISPADPSDNWTIYLNITPIVVSTGTSSQAPETLPFCDQGANAIQDWINNILRPNWTRLVQGSGTSRPALTMTLLKNDNATFSNLTIVPEIIDNKLYTIDLLDDAYGLASALDYPFSISTPIPTTPNIEVFYPVQFGYISSTVSENHPMGSLEFRSGNNYWIQQNYYFQQGGIFLEQPDGKVAKVIPLVSVTNKTGIPSVRVVDVTIDGSASVGGTSPVQVITTVQSIEDNVIGGQRLAKGIPNARSVTLVVEAQDQSTAQMWNQTFARVRSAALGEGFPAAWLPAPVQSGNTVQFTVSAPDYSVFFDYTRVNMTVSLQAVPV